MRTINNIKISEFYNLSLNKINDRYLKYYNENKIFSVPISISDTEETTIRTWKIPKKYLDTYYFINLSCTFFSDLADEMREIYIYLYNGNNAVCLNQQQLINTDDIFKEYVTVDLNLIHKIEDENLILKAKKVLGVGNINAESCSINFFSMINNEEISDQNMNIIES